MGERKVLNKYYPPDFDPAKLPRLKLGRDRQYKVRLMAPFNMRCKTCGHYIYKSTKFLATKETVQDETYLGLYIFRFYIKCPTCCAEITFKTDPKNSDYACEHGATRNFETWRMADRLGTIDDELEEEEEEENPMKALEERTKESRREMDILDALEDIKDMNARAAKVDVDELAAQKYNERLAEVKMREDELRKEEDNAIAAAFNKKKTIRRLIDDKPGSLEKVSEPSKKISQSDTKRPKLGDVPGNKSIGTLGGSLAGLVKICKQPVVTKKSTNRVTHGNAGLDLTIGEKSISKPQNAKVSLISDDSSSESDTTDH
eukprot:gene9569-1796_t